MRQHQALVFLLTEKGFVFVLLPKVKLIFTKQGQVITCVEQKSLHRPSRKRHMALAYVAKFRKIFRIYFHCDANRIR